MSDNNEVVVIVMYHQSPFVIMNVNINIPSHTRGHFTPILKQSMTLWLLHKQINQNNL